MQTTILEPPWDAPESCVFKLKHGQREIMDPSAMEMFSEVMKEKERMETEQIISRLMYTRDQEEAYDLEKAKEVLRRKFRNLAIYFHNINDHNYFGRVVTASIIREWPVTISHAEEESKDAYSWDRAPLSLPLKRGLIRKDCQKYVMRILALEGSDIGEKLQAAHHTTELLEVDDNEVEQPTDAYVVELIREGTANKRETSSPAPVVAKRSRPKKDEKKSTEDEEREELTYKKEYFRDGFDHFPYGSLVFRSRKNKTEYVDGDSKCVAFTIQNIAIHDPFYRKSVAQRYLMKSRFKFDFFDVNGDLFSVNTDYYQNDVRSMWFEGITNGSTHWEKSMPSIFKVLYSYFGRRGELTTEEKESKGEMLMWCHVKEMIRNFVNCQCIGRIGNSTSTSNFEPRSNPNFHIRQLGNIELRTVSRMIMAHRLADINDSVRAELAKDENSATWILNKLESEEQRKVFCVLDLDDDGNIETVQKAIEMEIEKGKTFTQSLLSVIDLKGNCAIRLCDFTNHILDLSGAEPMRSTTTSVHSWLHGVAEMISGPFLHKNARKTINMFNKKQITLLHAESAERTVNTIITSSRDEHITMLRIDEKEHESLTIHSIRPKSNQPSLYGSISAKALKETKKNHSAKGEQLQKAINEGIVSKTDHKLCGLYAYLKTGWQNQFTVIVELEQLDGRRRFRTRKLYKMGKDVGESVYSVNINPAKMAENQIDPSIGPIRTAKISTKADESFSIAPTIIHMMGNVTIATPPDSSAAGAAKTVRKRTTAKKKTSTSSPRSQQLQPSPQMHSVQPPEYDQHPMMAPSHSSQIQQGMPMSSFSLNQQGLAFMQPSMVNHHAHSPQHAPMQPMQQVHPSPNYRQELESSPYMQSMPHQMMMQPGPSYMQHLQQPAQVLQLSPPYPQHTYQPQRMQGQLEQPYDYMQHAPNLQHSHPAQGAQAMQHRQLAQQMPQTNYHQHFHYDNPTFVPPENEHQALPQEHSAYNYSADSLWK